jgi:hypothetical protein
MTLATHTNGSNTRGHPRDIELSRSLNTWLNDLARAEALRHQQLLEIGRLRREIYEYARAQGVPAKVLRAALRLRRGHR